MSDDAWSNFVAQLNSAELERERMAVHGVLDAERPGSRQDHEMRFAHEYVRFQAAAREAETAEARRARLGRAQVADADREIRARGFDAVATNEQESDIEAAVRSYSQRQAATAAERKTAA